MISPKAVHLIIKHFDAIDEVVARRLSRKRPWSEPALTSFLCDLLDQETQDEEKLRYTINELNSDLADIDGLLDLSFEIETHEYPPDLERWVTQSDLGLVVNYWDYLLPQESWSASWLLQAKRLSPDQRNPVGYSESSRFGAVDPKQRQRMILLEETVGIQFVKYLLYCPRPSDLDTPTQRKLAHLRNYRLSHNIFDYALGLELRDELSSIDSSLAAGLFISQIDSYPKTLGAVHMSIFDTCLPLSWFILIHFARGSDVQPFHIEWYSQDQPDGPHKRAQGIVRGDPDAITDLIREIGETDRESFQVLPPHTLTINVSVGHSLDPEVRRIRSGEWDTNTRGEEGFLHPEADRG